MGKNFEDLTPQELCLELHKSYGLSLAEFSVFLGARVGHRYWHIKPDGYNRQLYLNARKRLQNIENKIFEVFADVDAVRGFPEIALQYKKDKDQTKKELIQYLGLERFMTVLKDYDRDIRFYLRTEKASRPKLKDRIAISTVWAVFMQEDRGSIDWELINNLLTWFWTKLQGHDLYGPLDLSAERIDPEYLKFQFYRNRNKEEIRFFKSSVHRTQMKSTLTIFADHDILQSDDKLDLFFAHIHDSKEAKFCSDKLLSNKQEYSALDDYNKTALWFYYARKIFRKMPRPRPNYLIIFPDFSFFTE